mgnify:CR=1 FL=1
MRTSRKSARRDQPSVKLMSHLLVPRAITVGTLERSSLNRRGPPRGGVRPVTCTKTHVKRSLCSHKRCFNVPCMSLAPGASIYKRRVARVRRSPTPAALQVTLSTACQPCLHAEAMRCALFALLYLLLQLRPVAPARRARCPAASSGRPMCDDEARRCSL